MNLEALIASKKSAVAAQTKVASAAPSANADSNTIKSAIADVLSNVGSTKTASAETPTNKLASIAADVIASEKSAMDKEAMTYGAAIADGFVARLSDYEKVANEKLASEVTAEDLELIKMARENPAEFLAQVQAGYDSQFAQEKQAAEAAYTETYNNTVAAIHKTASEHYLAGVMALDAALQANG